MAERAPRDRIALLPRNQTVVCCSDSSQGSLGISPSERGLGPLHSLGTPGKEGEYYDLSEPGDQGLIERIRTSLQPWGCCLIMLLLFMSSRCQTSHLCHPVRLLLATRSLYSQPLFSHQSCCCVV